MIDNQELISKELGACPFCEPEDSSPEIRTHENLQAWGEDAYSVTCWGCDTHLAATYSPELAVKAWNKRSVSKQLTQTQQKLDVAVEALEWIKGVALKNYEHDPKLRSNSARTLKRILSKSETALNTIGKRL